MNVFEVFVIGFGVFVIGFGVGAVIAFFTIKPRKEALIEKAREKWKK